MGLRDASKREAWAQPCLVIKSYIIIDKNGTETTAYRTRQKRRIAVYMHRVPHLPSPPKKQDT